VHKRNQYRSVKSKPEEATVEVALRPSVAKDLIVVLLKFHENKMELLQIGQSDHAERLLGLNLFRHDLEEAIRKVT
jgi:hypothetical protein